MYLSIQKKFYITVTIAFAWLTLSVWLVRPWYHDLSQAIGVFFAVFLIAFIAIIPGFMNAFILTALLFDRRPQVRDFHAYPDVTILMPAYNEATSIIETVNSILRQDYPGAIQIILINDGSTDATLQNMQVMQANHSSITVIDLPRNAGKASALNAGLQASTTDLIITVDADCIIRLDGVKNLVGRYLSDPPNTRAVAGAILIRNSRENWITKAQEWDYFLGIAATKRVQSLFQGILVAQGAFSVYHRQTVVDLGGWPRSVGEDIVLTWAMLAAGHRIGHAENACAFTNCPNSLMQFIRQRQRWSRGMIEAFKAHPRILLKARFSTLFIWWNTVFPFMDVAYTFGFIPGIILACFGNFLIVGPMTLALLPLAFILNRIMYQAGKKMFDSAQMKVRSNNAGFVFYMIGYGLILQPACVLGYMSEIFNVHKSWGTK